MAIYEYHCDDCGQEFEVMQKITEDPLGTCKLCGGHVHRLISRNGFILKGKGWYATDYGKSRTGGANGSSSSDRESKSETAKTESSSSESSKSKNSASSDKKDASSTRSSTSSTT